MNESQQICPMETDELYARCATLRFDGYRLVQIGCTRTDSGCEINYTFDKNYDFLNLRIVCAAGGTIPSIQKIYECSYIYENEIAELFGLTIDGMLIDFKGELYKTAVKEPFASDSQKQEAESCPKK